MNTHYQELGLPETATAADIRRAYRRLVQLTHPDRTPDPAQHRRYLAINQAYETLSHPARRAAYDAALARQRQPKPASPKPAADPPAARSSKARRPPPAVFRPRKRHALVLQHFDYEPYVARARWWCRLLLLVPLLLALDWAAPKRTVTAAFDTAAAWRDGDGNTKYSIRTSHGDFSTGDEAALDAPAFQLRVSRLFRFVAEARLPSGRVLPLASENTVLLSLAGLVLALAGLVQLPRLPAEMCVHWAIVASVVEIIVLLMALTN